MDRPGPTRSADPASRPAMLRLLPLLVSLMLTGVALLLLSYFVELERIPAQLAETEPHWFAIIGGCGILLGLFGLGHKWWMVLRTRAPAIRYRDVLFLRAGSSPLLSLMPFKTGELVPAMYLQRRYGVPVARVLGTILFDKATTVLALLLLGVVAGLRSDALPLWVPTLAGLCVLAILIPGVPGAAVRLIRLDRTRLAGPLHELLACFDSFSLAARVGLVLYGMALQLGVAALLTLSLYAQGSQPPWDQALFLGPLVILVANLHLTVAGVGTRDAMILLLFAQWGTPEQLVGAATLFLILEVILPVVLGAVFLQPLLYRMVAGRRT